MTNEVSASVPDEKHSDETERAVPNSNSTQIYPSRGKRLHLEEGEEGQVDNLEAMLSIYFEKCSEEERRAFRRRVYEIEVR